MSISSNGKLQVSLPMYLYHNDTLNDNGGTGHIRLSPTVPNEWASGYDPSIDTINEANIKPDLTWYCENENGDATQHHITSWDQTTGVERGGVTFWHFHCIIKGTLTNTSNKNITTYLAAYISSGGHCGANSQTVTVPFSGTCGATAQDVDFGKLDAGSSKSSTLVITKSGNKGGVVTITGNDMQSDGTLNLNGNKGISVKPDSTDYIKGNTWYADTARGSIPLTLSSKKGVSGGDYSSTLTATLTCD